MFSDISSWIDPCRMRAITATEMWNRQIIFKYEIVLFLSCKKSTEDSYEKHMTPFLEARSKCPTTIDYMIYVRVGDITNPLQQQRMACWRHQMEPFSALLALCAGNSPVTGEFLSQRPVTRSFNVVFDLRRNKGLSKQMRRRWVETQSLSLRRHCNEHNEVNFWLTGWLLHIGHVTSGW